MIELRFHEELYDAAALDDALETYEPFATLALSRDTGGFRLQIEARPDDEDAADPALVAAELMNHALGKTIERTRAATAAASTTTSTSAAASAAAPPRETT